MYHKLFKARCNLCMTIIKSLTATDEACCNCGALRLRGGDLCVYRALHDNNVTILEEDGVKTMDEIDEIDERWIFVEDEMPLDDITVLIAVLDPEEDVYYYELAKRKRKTWEKRNKGGPIPDLIVTHWAEIPLLPESEAE